MNKFYDVIIIGGGTAGCATAYIAGKLGLKVLLIEKGIHLGGTMTSGLVVPVMKSGNHQINTDFYNILVEEMHKVGGQVTYQDNSGWFNPELMKIVLDKMMKDVSVDVRYNGEVKDVKTEGKYVLSLETNKEILSAPLYTHVFNPLYFIILSASWSSSRFQSPPIRQTQVIISLYVSRITCKLGINNSDSSSFHRYLEWQSGQWYGQLHILNTNDTSFGTSWNVIVHLYISGGA